MTIRVAGHFGEWLQGRLGPDGPIALVTLPSVTHMLHATWLPGPPRVQGIPPQTARAFLRDLGLHLPGTVRLRVPGRVRLRAGVTPGLGCGMSTARLVALARLAGWRGPPEALARACVAVEGASDPLMFHHPERLLWASRHGVSLGAMPAMPRFALVGGFFGGPVRTEAHDHGFADIRDLVAEWCRAQGLVTFAALASESARRNGGLRGPAGDPTETLARELGALGHVIAHTGAARGLIFAPGTVPQRARATLREAGLHRVFHMTGGDG